MVTVVAAFGLGWVVTWALAPCAARLARAVGAVDRPTSTRKIHRGAIPRLGGVAIFGAFLAAIAAGVLVDARLGAAFVPPSGEAVQRLGGVVVGALLVLAIGVVDDVAGARAREKLLVQLVAGALVWGSGVRLDAIAQPFGDPISLGALSLPATVLWLAAASNAMNLLDGLDAAAAGASAVSGLAVAALAAAHGDPALALVAVAAAGASAGFLRWNAHPARIFMGDGGSLFLGFVLGACALASRGDLRGGTPAAFAAVALAVPLGDTALAILRRALRGAPIAQGDRGHVHHRLLARGLSQRSAALAIHAACALLGGAALGLSLLRGAPALALLGGLAVAGLAALRALGYARVGALRQALRDRARNVALRSAVRAAASRLRAAEELADIGACLRDAAAAVGAEELRVRVEPGARAVAGDAAGPTAGDPARHACTEHPLRHAGVLQIRWRDGVVLDRDVENAVERLCVDLGSAVARVARERPADVARTAVEPG